MEYSNNSSIEKFPPELMHQIALELCTADISSLQKASRFLRATTQYSLYKNITWVFAIWSKPPIYLLVRSLLENPELGSLIHSLDFEQKQFPLPVWRRSEPDLTKEELEHLAQKGRSMTNSIPNSETWLQEYAISFYKVYISRQLLNYQAIREASKSSGIFWFDLLLLRGITRLTIVSV